MRSVEEIRTELQRHRDHIGHSWANKQVECRWFQVGLEWAIAFPHTESEIKAHKTELENSGQWSSAIQVRALDWVLQNPKPKTCTVKGIDCPECEHPETMPLDISPQSLARSTRDGWTHTEVYCTLKQCGCYLDHSHEIMDQEAEEAVAA